MGRALRSALHSTIPVGRRERLPAVGAARDVGTTIPLSLLFASLLASCGSVEANCEQWSPFEQAVVLTEPEFQYFTRDDGVLDPSECQLLCACWAPDFISSPRPDSGTRVDVDVSDGATIDDVVDGATSDGATSNDAGAGGASADADPGAGGGAAGGGGAGGGNAGAGGAYGYPSAGSCKARFRYESRFTLCADLGSTPDGHGVFCKGEQSNGVVCGRNSACHVSLGRGVGPSAVARWLAFSAATEAASIRSFRTLRRELRILGAPSDFVARAHRAMREEARHTRWMARLARDRGGKVEWPRSVPLPLRDLEAVATENAVEGCVRETLSALLNHHQAAYAADPEVRAVMTRIAIDETSHAELARDIDRWAMSALPAAARARVALSKRTAARDLAATLGDATPSVRDVLGLPTKSTLQFFADELEKRLWS